MPTTLLTLRDSLTRLTLAPELGASLVNWVRLSDGQPLLRHSDEQALAAGVWLCAEDKLSSQWVELPPA